MIPITRTTGRRAMWLALGGLAVALPVHVLALLGVDFDPAIIGVLGGGMFLDFIPAMVVALKPSGQRLTVDWTEALSGAPRWTGPVVFALFIYAWVTGMLSYGRTGNLSDVRLFTAGFLFGYAGEFAIFYSALKCREWAPPYSAPPARHGHPPEHGGTL